MSVSIRLSRVGKKGQPKYRILAAETRSKRNGNFSDLIGYYDPSVNPPILKIDQTKFDRWKNNGAIISSGLNKILKSENEKAN